MDDEEGDEAFNMYQSKKQFILSKIRSYDDKCELLRTEIELMKQTNADKTNLSLEEMVDFLRYIREKLDYL